MLVSDNSGNELPEMYCYFGERLKKSNVSSKLRKIWNLLLRFVADMGIHRRGKAVLILLAVGFFLLFSVLAAQAQAVDDLDCVDAACQEAEINESLVVQINNEFTEVSADIATNAADIATNAADIATNADGIATNADGIATNADGIATNADGIATNA
ncbi:hypothetical protein, partial [uncultured Ruegeria sp.]|uniref:hypothetical protein n=1 Tax=uncultured Ruegeria sp. TaxID=259304 RepID=UPI002625D274